MPYTEVPFTAKYSEVFFNSLVDVEQSKGAERSYDQRFLNTFLCNISDDTIINFSEEKRINLMSQIKFQFAHEEHQAVGIHKAGDPAVIITTTAEYYDAVIAAALKQKVVLTHGDVIAIFAFTFFQQKTFMRWLAGLSNPVRLNPHSTLEVSVKKIGDNLKVAYDEREKHVGDFTETSGLIAKKAETVFKAKVQGTLKLFNNTYTYTPETNPTDKKANKSISIATLLWKKLQYAATAYLNQARLDNLDDFFTLTPFLTIPEFRKSYNEKLAQKTVDCQDWAYHFISACFGSNPAELKKILADVPSARENINHSQPLPSAHADTNGIVIGESSTTGIASFTAPQQPSPSHSLNTVRSDSPLSLSVASTQPGRRSERRLPHDRKPLSSVQPINSADAMLSTFPPPPPPMSLAQQYELKRQRLEISCTKKTYESQQLASLITLKNELDKLNENEKAKHLVMLNNILDCTDMAVNDPGNETNLNECKLLIGPLRRESLTHLALALGLVVLGALITTACVAIAVASFGGTTLLSSWGITVATTALTKGLSIAGSVLGLGMMGGGLYWSTHQPFKKIIAAADTISNKAVSFWKQDKNHEAYRPAVVLPVSPSRSRSGRP